MLPTSYVQWWVHWKQKEANTKKAKSHFPRKCNCVARTLMSKSSNASQKQKNFFQCKTSLIGSYPKEQFNKRTSASLLSANLNSLLCATLLKNKKNRATHLLHLLKL